MENNEGGLERMEEVERLLGRCGEACDCHGSQRGVPTNTPELRRRFTMEPLASTQSTVIWYIFRSTSDTARARMNGLATFLEKRSREVLRTEGYPSEAIETIQVSFASDEEIHGAGGFRAFFT
ncbi:MAG: hypothetical protein IPP19_15890 [Verrucomicrobia bacterium]|nr:hypothetical protein [Verrucomicrobiota bacterium]